MNKRIVLVTAGLSAALVFGGGTALAASSGGPVSSTGVITGCYTSPHKDGSSRLRLQNAGTSCSPGESAVSWNEQGPAGPAGANGLNGTNGTDGTNGTSVATSSGPPSGANTLRD